MTILDSIILGIVEGITEFLPISSTAHLIITGKALGLQSEFLKSFDITIQLGAILAVIVLYGKKLFTDFDTILKVMTGFLPTAALGLLFYKMIKKYFMDDLNLILAALLVGGVIMILFEMIYGKKVTDDGKTSIGYRQAFIIGLCQSLAFIPGVSRAAATIFGGLALGINRKTIVEFSFLLAVPTMAAASGLDIIKNAGAFSAENLGLLAAGFFVSFIVAAAAIKLLLGFIQKNNFIPFGIYRIIAALAVFILMRRLW